MYINIRVSVSKNLLGDSKTMSEAMLEVPVATGLSFRKTVHDMLDVIMDSSYEKFYNVLVVSGEEWMPDHA